MGKKLLSLLLTVVMVIIIIGSSGLTLRVKAENNNKTVWFGNYYQTKVTDNDYISRMSKASFTDDRANVGGINIARRNNNYYYSSPIEWLVLDEEDDSYLLLSKKVLEKRSLGQFWYESNLRQWLNNDFYDLAFSDEEKNNIVTSEVYTIYDDYYDVYVNHVDPERCEVTNDNVFLLTKLDVLNSSYGWSDSEDADDSKIAYTSQYVDDKEGACTWFVREPFWFYGTLRDRFVTSDGRVVKGGMRDTGAYGVRPAIRVKKSAVSETMPQTDYNFSLENYDAEKAVLDAMPDMANLGGDMLKGPEITMGGKAFNLWSSDVKFSINLKGGNLLTAKYDASEQTVDVLIGLGPLTSKEIKSPDPNSDDYDDKWKSTYNEIKSMVNACNMNTSVATWNKFQKTREKLKKIDAKAVYSAKGSVAGYVKFKLDNGKPADILESGMIANLEVGGSVKTPLFYVVYSEFGIAGKAEGKVYVDYKNSYQLKGSVKLTFEPSVAIGADIKVIDVKGGIKGDIIGSVSFPWKSFKDNVNASITGSLFISAKSIIPGLNAILAKNEKDKPGGFEKSWNFQTLELYPELGKITDGDINFGYTGIKPTSLLASKEVLYSAKNVVSNDMASVVYENAKPQMIEMNDGNYLVAYLDEVEVDGKYQVKAMYRIGDGDSWSEPIEINNETVVDTAVKIAKCNGVYYFIYEGSKKEFDESMESSEIAGSLKLFVSTLENGEITKNEILSDEGNFKYDYDLVIDNDTITAVWAENTENDIMLESGGTEVYSSKLEEEKWSDKTKMFSNNEPIEEFSAGLFDNNVSMAYIYNDYLYINNKRKTTGISEGNFDSPQICDGKIYLRSNGQLYSYDGSKSMSTNIYCGVNYIVEGSDVYWNQQVNFKSDIYKQEIGSNVSAKVTDDDTYIDGFCVIGSSEKNKDSIIYTSQNVNENLDNPYGATVLSFDDSLVRCKALVTDIGYNIIDFNENGLNEFTFEITNDGTEDLHNVKLIVESDGKTIYSDVVIDELKFGNQKTITLKLPDVKSDLSLNAYVEASESIEGNNSYLMTVDKPAGNISLSQIEDNKFQITNESEEDAKNIVFEIKDSQYGNIIRSINIDALSSGGNKIIELDKKDWVQAHKIEKINDGYSLYCQIHYNENEMELGDNSLSVQIVDRDLTDEISNINKNGENDSKEDNGGGNDSIGDDSGEKNDSSIDNTIINDNSADSSTNNIEKITLSAMSVTSVVPSTNEVVFKWDSDSNATGFNIEYSVNADLTGLQKGYWNKNSLGRYRLTGLSENTLYYYRVRSYKGDGDSREYSEWTQISSVQTKAKTITTESPQNIKYSAPKIKLKSVKNNKKNTITVKWKWNVKADGYQISYSKKKNFSGAKKKNVNAYKDSIKIKGLTKGKTYYVRIRSFVKDDYGTKIYSKWSSKKKVKIKK